jgi:hypothetical protein
MSPTDRMTGNPIQIQLAGGEYEIAVLEVPASAVGEMAVFDRRGIPAGYTIQLYVLPPVMIKTPSRWFDGASATGAWFDPCVPLAYETTDHEIRFRMPQSIGDADSEADYIYFLLELFAPHDGPSVDEFVISGRLERAQPREISAVLPDVIVRPFPFSLPREHSVPVLAGLGYEDIMTHHRDRGLLPWEEEDLWIDYLRVFREHRLIPYDPMPAQRFETELFEQFVLPFYRGEITPDGVPVPALLFPQNPHSPGTPDADAFLDYVTEQFRDSNLLDRTVYYIYDEPLLSDYPLIIEDALHMRNISPKTRILLTEPYASSLSGIIDIWCIDIPFYSNPVPLFPVYGRGSGLFPDYQVSYRQEIYTQQADAGYDVWLYTCMSAQFLDYPNMFIDAVPAAHRVIPWLLYQVHGTGLIYYNTTYAYNDGNDPWLNQYYFQSNGDGTLLYPGRPDLPYIDRHRGIASLRMKLLRDGLEDAEYLLHVSGVDTVRKIVQSPLRWEHDQTMFLKARNP